MGGVGVMGERLARKKTARQEDLTTSDHLSGPQYATPGDSGSKLSKSHGAIHVELTLITTYRTVRSRTISYGCEVAQSVMAK